MSIQSSNQKILDRTKNVQRVVKPRNGSAAQNTFGAANNDGDRDTVSATATLVNGERQKAQSLDRASAGKRETRLFLRQNITGWFMMLR